MELSLGESQLESIFLHFFYSHRIHKKTEVVYPLQFFFHKNVVNHFSKTYDFI